MSLKHTILAMLESGEITGYGIAKKFHGTFGFFWNASHQQVYQELAKLADDSLVNYQSITQSGKPDKKVYSITPKGLEELKRWIAVPMDLPKIKDQLMVKLFVGHLVNPGILQQQIDRHKKLHQDKLNTLNDLAQKNVGQVSIEKKLSLLALKRGISLHQTWLTWAEEVQVVLNEMEASERGFTDVAKNLAPEDAWMLESVD